MEVKPVPIGDRKIGPGFRPLVVAEMSGNHNHSLNRALQIVDAAADAGADAVKLQTYTADTMTLPLREREFFVSDPDNQWAGRSLHELYDEAHTPWEWHRPIFDRCRERGMLGFSSPFDASAVEFLEKLDVPCYKVASFENVDIPLIRLVAATGKPVIISTGMASVEELGEAVGAARSAGCKDLVLLKCTSTYPATPDNSDLKTIPHMMELFGCPVGLSDHTLGIGAAIASVALGASFIEKHVTLKRSDGGVDSSFSLEIGELKNLVEESESAWRAIGSVHYGPTDAEIKSLAYRRSLYAVADIKSGDVFDRRNVRAIRPGLGLAPKFFDTIIGRRAKKDIVLGTPLSWDLVA